MNRWEYLLTPAFQARYALAANYVRDCSVVVEVGAWKNCIADYLQRNHPVIVIDPLAECSPKEGQEVEIIAEPLQNVDMAFLREEDYGLVFLGFELVGDRSEIAMEKFINMANDAKTVVIEYATEHTSSVRQVDEVLRRCNKREHLRVKLDVVADPESLSLDGFPPFYKRVFVVWR